MTGTNPFSIQISNDDLNKIQEALQTIIDVLKPNLITLTTAERSHLPKMKDKTVAFVQKAMNYSVSNPEFNPPYLNREEFSLKVAAVEDLTSILNSLQHLVTNLDDTIMFSGSAAYADALSYYNTVKTAVKRNVPFAKDINDDLSTRFLHLNNSKPDSVETT